MRTLGLLVLALAISGCCQSHYAHDPRAAVIGPAYLDYIADYPRDCATEYYYPSFVLAGVTTAPPQPLPSTVSLSVDSLLIQRPPESSRVENETGKGYPKLESKGIRLFTRAGD